MKKARELDNILEDCLERVLKGETIEQCLADYPEHAVELEPLLRTALDTREAAAIKPRPEFRDRARYQFQAALRETEPEKDRGFFGWQRRWVTVVVSVFALLVVVSGTVVAAGDSLPDSPLYKVKLATEAVRLALTPSTLGKAELYAEFADKRVEEIIKMADKGNTEQVVQTTERLDSHLVAMASLVEPDEEEPAEGGVATFESAPLPMDVEEVPQVQVEEALPAAAATPETALTPETVPEPEPALEPAPTPEPAITAVPAPVEKMPVEEAPTAQVRDLPLEATEKEPVAAPRVSLSTDNAAQVMVDEGEAEGVELEREEKLKQLLLRRAVENPEALEEALARVPESVKDALRRAIEVADQGYEQALSNLD
jgi:hypothetical protein